MWSYIVDPIIFPLREKCWNTEFFLVHIFLYSDWIRRFSILSEYRKIRTRKKTPHLDTFTQCSCFGCTFVAEQQNNIRKKITKTSYWSIYENMIIYVKLGNRNLPERQEIGSVSCFWLYRSSRRTSAWVFSCKFAAYIQNTFY